MDVLIDDCLHYALDCQKKDIPVILFDCPWNREKALKEEGLDRLPAGIVRAKDWNQVIKVVNILKKDKEAFYRL